MSDTPCRHQPAVEDALRGAGLSEALRDHVVECSACSEVLLVQRILSEHAVEATDDRPLPDPGYIWWRARLQSRYAAAERATQVITIVQRLAVACGGIVTLLAVLRFWSVIKGFFARVLPDSLPTPLPADVAQPGLVIAASVAVIGLLIVFDFFGTWARD